MGVSFSQVAMVPHACLFTIFGALRVFLPVSSMALLGMEVDPTDVSLLNELSGNHALNLGFGLLACLGIVSKDWRKMALAGSI